MSGASTPPGPKGTWLGGNVADFREDRLGFIQQCAQDYGDVVRIRLGPYRILLISHPDLIEQVLITNRLSYRKHFAMRLNPQLFGKGLLTSEGDFWLRQRRIIQPLFLRKHVVNYAPDIIQMTRRFLDGWTQGETRNVSEEMARLTLTITAKIMFGAEVREEAEEVRLALHDLLKNFLARFGSLTLLPRWVPTPHNLRTQRANRRLDQIIYRYIERRRKETEARNDVLSLLLQATDEDGSKMSDQQIRDEAITLFLAGHETTALSLAWTWHLLATHPEVEEKLVQEVHEVVGDREVTAEDVLQLNYLNQVIHESMRHRPPVYSMGREALTDQELGGYPVPKGTTLLMPQWVVHHDARWYEDPEEFRPRRWTSEFTERLHKCAYYPFGGGPRRCIGDHFGLMEIALVLATIAQRFRFAVVEQEVKPTAIFTLRPEPEIHAPILAR